MPVLSDRAPRLIGVLAAAAMTAYCIHVFADNKADVDLWGNVGFVTAMPWSDGYAYENTFSFTEPDHAWINHEWLAQWVFHKTFAACGNTGLLALKTLMGLGLAALLWRAIRRACPSGALAFLYMLLTVSTIGYGFSTRPHLFTYLMLAGLLTLLRAGARPRPAAAACCAGAAVLWVNLHGAFFIGIVVLLLFGLARLLPARAPQGVRSARLPLGAAAGFFALSFLNPYGPRLWSFVFESGGAMRPYLSEWAPFHPLRHAAIHPDFVVLAAVSAAAVALSRARRDPAWLALLATALAAAFLMRRNIPLFAIVAAFAVPRHLDGLAGRFVTDLAARMRPAVLALLLALLAGGSLAAWAVFNKRDPLEIEIPADRYPLDTMAYIDAHGLSGNAIVFFDWAEAAIWHLYPRCRVFMDGRFLSAYSQRAVRDYFAFLYGGPGWRRALDAYDTDMVLVHAGNPAAANMAALPGWTRAHAAGPAVLFVRRDRFPALPKAEAPAHSSVRAPVFP